MNVRDVPFPLNAFLHGWHNGGSQICIFMISLHHVYSHYYLHVMLDVILSMFLNILVQSCSLIAFVSFFSFFFFFFLLFLLRFIAWFNFCLYRKVLACVVCGRLKSAFQIASRSGSVADVQYVAHQVM